MKSPVIVMALLVSVMAAVPALAEEHEAKVGLGGGTLESVKGLGCYTIGDEDTPAKAQKTAMALARQQAVESYRVYVQSATSVKNFQVEDDLIQTASAGMLQDVQMEKKEEKGREICVTIVAKISPVKMEELIQQKTKAKDIAQAAQAPLLAGGVGFGLKVWTNKANGAFVEGDRLIVSVQSDRDGYLKLDYYQADGTVVHLVPNLFGGEAFIKAGKIYIFGGPDGKEAFTIQGPFGAEAIKALVSTQPFEQGLMAGRNVEDSRGYLGTLQRATRGVGVGASAAAGRVEWAEGATGLVTMSRVVEEQTRSLGGTRGLRGRSQPPDPSKPTATTGTQGLRPDEATPRP